MIQKFNDLPWHDAELKEIVINRSQSHDKVKILVEWPEAYEGGTVEIEFFGCYAFQSDMHFGIMPPDSILDAECTQNSIYLDKIIKI